MISNVPFKLPKETRLNFHTKKSENKYSLKTISGDMEIGMQFAF